MHTNKLSYCLAGFLTTPNEHGYHSNKYYLFTFTLSADPAGGGLAALRYRVSILLVLLVLGMESKPTPRCFNACARLHCITTYFFLPGTGSACGVPGTQSGDGDLVHLNIKQTTSASPGRQSPKV